MAHPAVGHDHRLAAASGAEDLDVPVDGPTGVGDDEIRGEAHRACIPGRPSRLGDVRGQGGLRHDDSFRERQGRSTRARRRAAKAGRGSIGDGGERRASKGSGIVGLLLSVGAAEGARGPARAVPRWRARCGPRVGDVGDREIIEIAQRQHGAVQRRQLAPRCPGPAARRARRPSCLRRWSSSRRASVLLHGAQAPFLAGLAAPVVDELVAGHPDQPRHRDRRPCVASHGVDGGEEWSRP